MVMKLGINGFGRIGRLVTRAALDNPDASVVAINDPFLTPEYAAYLLKHDSVHGKYEKEISHDETHLIVGDHKIRFFCERNPAGKFQVPVWRFEREVNVQTEAVVSILDLTQSCEAIGLYRMVSLAQPSCLSFMLSSALLQTSSGARKGPIQCANLRGSSPTLLRHRRISKAEPSSSSFRLPPQMLPCTSWG